jgi:branched-chain amino acid transport system permease protein
VVVADFFNQNFTSILNGVALGMLLFILAVGLSLIFGLLDVLNLAHGSLYLLGSYIGYQLIEKQGIPFIPAMLLVALIGLGLGVVLNAFLRPIRGRGHLDQVLLTLGLLFIVADLVTIIWGADFLPIGQPGFLERSVVIHGHYYPAYRLGVIVVGVGIALAMWFLFERTQLGAIVRAAVEDRDMVGALGINVGRVMLAVLALGAALATFAGVIGAPILTISPGIGNEVLILALIVVVIGGLGSITGAFVGALIIGEVQSLGVALIPELAPFATFAAMALILIVRPTGLFGR